MKVSVSGNQPEYPLKFLRRHPLPHVQPCFACSLPRLLVGCGITSNEGGINHPQGKLLMIPQEARYANVRRSPKRWKVCGVCQWIVFGGSGGDLGIHHMQFPLYTLGYIYPGFQCHFRAGRSPFHVSLTSPKPRLSPIGGGRVDSVCR